MVVVFAIIIYCLAASARAFAPHRQHHDHNAARRIRSRSRLASATTTGDDDGDDVVVPEGERGRRRICIIGAGWGGLSAAHALVTSGEGRGSSSSLDVTIVDASARAGGLVRDGYGTIGGMTRGGEAGQHGFWDNYRNIFSLLNDLPTIDAIDDVLTGYAEQGQYSPRGLEAVWPVFRTAGASSSGGPPPPRLPTGLAQALYTRFLNLPPLDRASALPLVLAFLDFDDSVEAWEKYDASSFRDMCTRLGVSRRCYDEAIEPMVLTGLFAPGSECSAAAALGMAYFFVLRTSTSFDVRWCRGNVGEMILDPWVAHLRTLGVNFETSARVRGFEMGSGDNIARVICTREGREAVEEATFTLDSDSVVFAVGGAALNAMVRNSPELSRHSEFRKFTNLRGTGVLATRLYLDSKLDVPYSANACWGFDRGVGMTFFDITTLHDVIENNGQSKVPGSVIEIDYYHAASLLVMSDAAILEKAKRDLDTILGRQSIDARVLDATIVRLPQAVNWYSPGSYANMPDVRSSSILNVYFCGDLVRSRHGSWSQEKAFVTGIEAANSILGRKEGTGIVPLSPDEPHVAVGRTAVRAAKMILGLGDASRAPSFVDFCW
ncbi:hypothetical protein ACHAW5_003576 [Stephanodiscus triporus]|uniref:Amine oxidase domain-containing protein n=1 Tax=Stephanodiscus triporus TaxID=2934178 RepID=A0ABD3PIJ6_9STRA